MGKPRKSKEPWELLYDVTSAGEAEMIRLLFEATGVKYTNVKLGPSEIPDDSINIEYTNIPQEGGSDCSKESIKKGDNSNEEDLDHKGKLPRVAKGKLPRMAKGKQRKRGLSQVSDGTRESQCETGPSAAKKAKVLIDGGRLPYPRLPVIRKGDVEISHVVSILRYLAELYGVCPESHEDKLLADQIVQYCWDYWTEGRFVIAGNAFTKNDPPLAQGRQHYVDIFTKERMPMWLKFFEECLKKTMDGKKFLFGKTLCYADLVLYHVLTTTMHHYRQSPHFSLKTTGLESAVPVVLERTFAQTE